MIETMAVAPGMWQVTSGGRWWTVARVASATMVGWHITNEAGRTINEQGQLGRKLIAAVEAKIKEDAA